MEPGGNGFLESPLSLAMMEGFVQTTKDVFVVYRLVRGVPVYAFANKEAEKVLECDDVTGKSNKMLLGEGAESIDRYVLQAFETKLPVKVEHEIPVHDGIRIYDTLYTPFQAPVSESLEWLVMGVCRDFSGESLRTERRCKQPECGETKGAKNMFLANMSHDIRTPLNGILAVMELLGSTPLTEEQSDLLRTGKTSGECLLALVNDILDLAKVEENKLSLDIKPFNLEDIVHSCLDMVSLQATSKGLELLSTFESNVPEIVFQDQLRVKQILSNLLSNAIKFTEFGEVILSVKIENSDEKGNIILQVKDTGVGISQGDIPLVMEPFNQVHDSTVTRSQTGTGLGLAIASRLCRIMGGDLQVESTLGKGSIFTASVRACKSVNHSNGVRNTMENPGRSVIQKNCCAKGINVLVVDNNKTCLNIIQSYISILGATVTTAESGEEALRMMKQRHADCFDIAIIDAVMPHLDGFEFFKRMMRVYPKSAILKQRRAILLTHMNGAQEARSFSKMHPHLFASIVFKPCKPSLLLNSVQNIVTAIKRQSIQDEAMIKGFHKKDNKVLSKRHANENKLSEQYKRASPKHNELDQRIDSESCAIYESVRKSSLVPKENFLEAVRILLVEDNPVNVVVTLKLLKRMGGIADIVSNGHEAIEKLKLAHGLSSENPPSWTDSGVTSEFKAIQGYDLVLMDYHMPKLDGLSAIRHLRKLWKGKSQRPPIFIVLTADAMSGDREMCLAAGADEYISKPVQFEILYQTIIQFFKSRI